MKLKTQIQTAILAYSLSLPFSAQAQPLQPDPDDFGLYDYLSPSSGLSPTQRLNQSMDAERRYNRAEDQWRRDTYDWHQERNFRYEQSRPSLNPLLD